MKPLTPEQIGAMRSALDMRKRRDLRFGALLTCLCLGLKRMELLNLRVGDVNLQESGAAIRVTHTSWRKRILPLQPDERALLKRYVDWLYGDAPPADALFFVTMATRHPFRKSKLTAKSLQYAMDQMALRTGLKRRVTAESFRKGFAAVLVTNGAPFHLVQKAIGLHSASAMIAYYRGVPGRKEQAETSTKKKKKQRKLKKF